MIIIGATIKRLLQTNKKRTATENLKQYSTPSLFKVRFATTIFFEPCTKGVHLLNHTFADLSTLS